MNVITPAHAQAQTVPTIPSVLDPMLSTAATFRAGFFGTLGRRLRAFLPCFAQPGLRVAGCQCSERQGKIRQKQCTDGRGHASDWEAKKEHSNNLLKTLRSHQPLVAHTQVDGEGMPILHGVLVMLNGLFGPLAMQTTANLSSSGDRQCTVMYTRYPPLFQKWGIGQEHGAGYCVFRGQQNLGPTPLSLARAHPPPHASPLGQK